MALLSEIIEYLDRELRTSSILDYPGAMNGLQLANDGEIERIVAAVDAALPVIEAAAAVCGPGLLIVHHGMFWQGAQPVTGAFYRKLKVAMNAGLAIYSSHLPVDVHPELGNNILLARAIGLENPQPFCDQKGLLIGIHGSWYGRTRDDLADVLQETLGGRIHVCPGGPATISKVGIITGGAGSEGVDTFITGEGPHWSFPLAEELGLNVFYGGHYATETFGVRAIAARLSEIFGVPSHFHDHPTGL